jgi:predicted transcriptional regulator
VKLAVVHAPAAASKRATGEKRSPEQLAQLVNSVANHLRSNPDGVSVEQIAAALGATTKELTLPVRKLLADKLIRAVGQKRATRYFPAASAVAAE